MAFTVTSSGRRLVMGVLLTLAASGAVLRYLAPNPSVLRDVGTLLLVLWLPAVGNLVAFLLGKLPRRPPRVTGFAPGAVFTPHLQVQLEPVDPGARGPLPDAPHTQCTLIVGHLGFTARAALPVMPLLAAGATQPVPLELLHPANALAQLTAGTAFHLLLGTTAVARGRVL